MTKIAWITKLADFYYFKAVQAQNNQLQQLAEQWIAAAQNIPATATNPTLKNLLASACDQLHQNPQANIDPIMFEVNATGGPVVKNLVNLYRQLRLAQNTYAEPETETVSTVEP
jgi:hypothetical protein